MKQKIERKYVNVCFCRTKVDAKEKHNSKRVFHIFEFNSKFEIPIGSCVFHHPKTGPKSLTTVFIKY